MNSCRLAILVFLCCFASVPLAAESLHIPRINQTPRLDGSLDDPVWKKAAKVDRFMQLAPGEGQPSTELTTAYMAYDSKNLYLAFDCKDSEPSKIRAHFSPRDQIFNDDWVLVIMDTFGDQRRAYEFGTNPLGVQMDLLNSDGQEDTVPDFVFYSAGAVSRNGYAVEMRIPFKSLRFRQKANQQWRILFCRHVIRKNEKSSWPPLLQGKGPLLTQTAFVNGIRDLPPSKHLEFIPEFTASRTNPFESQKDAFHIGQWNARAGLNFKYGITPSWTLDSTYNPDFSQVEADQPQIEVNQRYPLFFAEKRPFFLEGIDLFSTPIRVVHTRTIVDPQYGVKLTGKQGAYSVGLLSANDRSRNESVFNILRLKRDVGKISTLGLVFSDRELGLGEYNRVGGVDGKLRFKDNYYFSFQALESFTKQANNPAVDGPAYKVSVGQEAKHFGFIANYNDTHPDFQVDSGFLERVDVREAGMELWYDFWPSSGPLLTVRPVGGFNRIYNHQGTLTDESYFAGARLTLPLQTYFFFTHHPDILERFSDVNFRKKWAYFEFSSQPTNFLSGSVSFEFGDQISYDATPPFLGNGYGGSLNLILRPTSRLNLQQIFLKSRLDTKGGSRVFDENIWRSKLTFQWNKEISSRLIYQYGTLEKEGFGNALLTYLLIPGTAVHLGYNITFQRAGSALKKTKEIFFTKLSYLFRI